MIVPTTPGTRATLPALVDQALALDVYFDALLSEAAPQVDSVTAADPEATTATSLANDAPFQVLLFRVAGLTLAVPLAELHGVMAWPRCITPLPGHAPFFLGVLTHLGRNVKIIDTGCLIVPDQRRREKTELRHIVLIGGGQWGLACEDIAEMITLAPDEVRWRGARTVRPWLAGTVTKHLCALLDTRAFAAELGKGQPAA